MGFRPSPLEWQRPTRVPNRRVAGLRIAWICHLPDVSSVVSMRAEHAAPKENEADFSPVGIILAFVLCHRGSHKEWDARSLVSGCESGEFALFSGSNGTSRPAFSNLERWP